MGATGLREARPTPGRDPDGCAGGSHDLLSLCDHGIQRGKAETDAALASERRHYQSGLQLSRRKLAGRDRRGNGFAHRRPSGRAVSPVGQHSTNAERHSVRTQRLHMGSTVRFLLAASSAVPVFLFAHHWATTPLARLASLLYSSSLAIPVVWRGSLNTQDRKRLTYQCRATRGSCACSPEGFTCSLGLLNRSFHDVIEFYESICCPVHVQRSNISARTT